eukprot:TRINITY_DN42962_c0_g1_i1.p1 TRINITY_DN42962_c0_g1~~TRINITY_DN42962_c0_g1_i1.p1  ORF type:complete len:546 (+),score=83.64 TRINITY_DN42962_c0_g1_i1:22-1659(+)
MTPLFLMTVQAMEPVQDSEMEDIIDEQEEWNDVELQHALAGVMAGTDASEEELFEDMLEGPPTGGTTERELPDPDLIVRESLPPEPPAAFGRDRGTVAKFAAQRGFGIIIPDDGSESLFAHWSSIYSDDEWPQLSAGMRVEYKASVGGDGKAAAEHITLIGGGKVSTAKEIDRKSRSLSTLPVTGTVHFFHPAGYGFITSHEDIAWEGETISSGSKIYVSREELVVAEGSTHSLAQGMQVQFKVYKPPGRPLAAAEVTAIGGGPIVSEAPSDQGVTNSVSNTESRKPRLGVKRRIQKLSKELDTSSKKITSTHVGQNASDSIATEMNVSHSADQEDKCNSQPAECVFFAAGKCTKGSACPFAHGSTSKTDELASQIQQALDELKESESAAATTFPELPLGWAAFRDPTSGGIYYGHVESGQTSWQPPSGFRIAAAPEVLALSASRQESCSLPCKFFIAGCCTKGSHCKFLHLSSGPGSLPIGRTTAQDGKDSASSRVCKFFLQNICTRGDTCEYVHSSTSSATPCKFFAQGSCSRGASCLFSHDS